MKIIKVDPSGGGGKFRKVSSLPSGLYMDAIDNHIIYSVDKDNERYTEFNTRLGTVKLANVEPDDSVQWAPYKGKLVITGDKN